MANLQWHRSQQSHPGYKYIWSIVPHAFRYLEKEKFPIGKQTTSTVSFKASLSGPNRFMSPEKVSILKFEFFCSLVIRDVSILCCLLAIWCELKGPCFISSDGQFDHKQRKKRKVVVLWCKRTVMQPSLLGNRNDIAVTCQREENDAIHWLTSVEHVQKIYRRFGKHTFFIDWYYIMTFQW